MLEPATALQVRPKKMNPWLAVALVVFSFGLLLPVLGLAFLFDRRPRTIDREGIVTARGRKYLWTDLIEGPEPHVEYRRTPTGKLLPVHRSLRFRFSTGRLFILPETLENGPEVVAYLERMVGRSLKFPA
jgi:hypothetical protein